MKYYCENISTILSILNHNIHLFRHISYDSIGVYLFVIFPALFNNFACWDVLYSALSRFWSICDKILQK